MALNRIRTIVERMADEPFRFFFPVGVACALIGVSYWPLKIFGLAFTDVPTRAHAYFQIYGFMFAFILGFLGTAAPRLTQAPHLTTRHLVLLTLNFFVTLGLLTRLEYGAAHISYIVNLLLFVGILVERIRFRAKNPPASFIFIPFAFLSAVAGTLILTGTYLGDPARYGFLYGLGVTLSFQGFVLMLVIGVGAFLIRSIFGYAPTPPSTPAEIQRMQAGYRRMLLLHGCAALAILLSFLVEFFWHREIGIFLRASLITIEAMSAIKIHRPARSGKLTATALQISLWCLVGGHWLLLVIPGHYAMALNHVIFVGGFTATTFAVATRVILSHCGYSSYLSGRWLPFTISIGLILFATASRVTSDFLPASYDHHLAYAGMTWLIGLLIWSGAVLTKGLRDTFCRQGPLQKAC